MPFMNAPDISVMHQSMNPIMAEVCNHQIAQHPHRQRQLKNHGRHIRPDRNQTVVLFRDRHHPKPVTGAEENIVPQDLPIIHLPGRPDPLDAGHHDEPHDEHEWEKQIVIENKLTNL
jgi:hypothetical protein